ncbi:MAG: hypothetical protein CFE45_02225 [Burkholderiales bacterium PBB5]|nr:MAG: hypothetical protein CFE45_02225 [Burkholderiales bacterium PBB5]
MPKYTPHTRFARRHLTGALLALGVLATLLWPLASTESPAPDDAAGSTAHVAPHGLLPPPSHLLMDVHHMLTLMGR